jgi:hypothetical protein
MCFLVKFIIICYFYHKLFLNQRARIEMNGMNRPKAFQYDSRNFFYVIENEKILNYLINDSSLSIQYPSFFSKK